MKIDDNDRIDSVKSNLRIARDSILASLAALDQIAHFSHDIDFAETLADKAKNFITTACDELKQINRTNP